MESEHTQHAEAINNLSNSFYTAAAMKAAIKLDIFSCLSQGAKTSAELANSLGIQEVKIVPLLFILVNAGLLKIHETRFENTSDAERFLVKGKPTYKGTFIDYMFDAVMKSDESIRSGKPQAKIDYSSLPEEFLMHIYRGLHPGTYNAGIELAGEIDFSRYSHILDVAGGSGGIAIGICAKTPGIHATVLELPSVVPITQKFIAEEGIQNRIGVLPCDIIHEIPKGTYDCVVMRYFIQVISPADALQSLKNCHQALKPGGALYIIGKVLDDSRLFPEETVNFNLVFLNLYYDGTAYTESEILRWLSEAGFSNVQVKNNIPPWGEGVITAYKI